MGGSGGIWCPKVKVWMPTGWILPCDLYEPEHHHSCWLYRPGSTPPSPGAGFGPERHQIKGGALSCLLQHAHGSGTAGPRTSPVPCGGSADALQVTSCVSLLHLEPAETPGSWVLQPFLKHLLGNSLEPIFLLSLRSPLLNTRPTAAEAWTSHRVKFPPPWCTSKGTCLSRTPVLL